MQDLTPALRLLLDSQPGGQGVREGGCLNARLDPGFVGHAGGTLEVAGGKAIQLPQLGSMTIDDALTMQRSLANDLPAMVNKNASLHEQAFQAVQIKNDLTISLRTAMDDANAAAQLGMISPIRSFDEMVRARSREYAGDALYRQVIADAQAEMRLATKAPAPYGLCFAAGTLIHTKEGLKPIEQIQVGDWVLTQPEETGERTYKRVTRTTRFEDAAVWTVTYYPKAERDKARTENRTMPVGTSRRLVVTPNHPFWVKGKGWVQVKDLWALNNGQGFSDESAWAEFDGYEFELADGQSAVLSDVYPLYRTEVEGVAWHEGMFNTWDGFLIDLRDGVAGEQTFVSTGAPKMAQPDLVERWDESCYSRCTVFNFEVEDCHTYYVGTLGVWVHNTHCAETETLSDRAIAIRNSLIPNRGTGVYWTETEARGLSGPNRGVILVRETTSQTPWAEFQKGTEGAQIVDGDSAAFAYIFENPNQGGRNFIKAGDGRAEISSGVWSKTTIDAKYWHKRYRVIADDIDAQNNFVNYLQTLSSALKQNGGYTHVIEFAATGSGGNAARDTIANVIKARAAELPEGFFGRVFVSTRLETGKLADNLIGFKVTKSKTGEVSFETYEVSKNKILEPLEAAPNAVKDVATLFKNGEPIYQEVENEGTVEATSIASTEALRPLFEQAKQFWLDHGAPASVLSGAGFGVGVLPDKAVAQTLGNHITLSPDAAGWGWFIDATPADNEEFAQIGASLEYLARSGSAAEGRIDLLGVMIHELGHVLGLEHSDDAHDDMAATAKPGLRRLPDVDADERFSSVLTTGMQAARTLTE